MESIESFREFISLPVFYLGIVLFGMFVNVICMPIANHYSFGWLHGIDRDRGWKIADRIIKIQIFAVIVMVIAAVVFVIGLSISKDHFTPFF